MARDRAALEREMESGERAERDRPD
jgi:hypothetical protein